MITIMYLLKKCRYNYYCLVGNIVQMTIVSMEREFQTAHSPIIFKWILTYCCIEAAIFVYLTIKWPVLTQTCFPKPSLMDNSAIFIIITYKYCLEPLNQFEPNLNVVYIPKQQLHHDSRLKYKFSVVFNCWAKKNKYKYMYMCVYDTHNNYRIYFDFLNHSF